MNQVVQTPEQQYYSSKLLSYAYKIFYKPGKANKVADALLWQDFPNPPQLLILSVPVYDFLHQRHTKNQNCLICRKSYSDPHPIYKSINGIKNRNHRPTLKSQSSFKQTFWQELHRTPPGRYSRMERTYRCLSANIFLENMKEDVIDYIAAYQICQQCKTLPKQPADLTQPIPFPSTIWEDISMDSFTCVSRLYIYYGRNRSFFKTWAFWYVTLEFY